MAMPASGILRLSGCSQSCGSIMRAACGSTATAPVCLTALATAAGKASCMSAFYSYDDTMVVTPTSFTSIPNTCVTCSVTTCAPAFNTACVCTSCSWLVPATPVTPAPAGNSHNVVVCANAGAARCGTVCYVSVCGGNCAVTLCQVAGVTTKSINFCCLGGCSCSAVNCCFCCACGCLYTSSAMAAGDCYCMCCFCICYGAAAGSCCTTVSCVGLSCNGTLKYNCSFSTFGCWGCTATMCALVKYGECWNWFTSVFAAPPGCAAHPYACICFAAAAVTCSCGSTFCRGTTYSEVACINR
jgi:hypothetical protein